jgi:CRP-like cAMP-binding protein
MDRVLPADPVGSPLQINARCGPSLVPPNSNLLLEMLPPDYRASLRSRMEAISLPVDTVLYRPAQRPKYAHFMTSGIASIVVLMADGNGPEVGLIGREGLVEGFHLLGPASVPTNGLIRIEGTALRIPFAELQKEFVACEPLRRRILESVQVRCLIGGQIAACNRLHSLEQRLARWLLMVQDRIGGSMSFLTQQFLAEMLGAQRTSVNAATGSLQRSGVIQYRRGHVRILDHEALESAACECYPIVRELMLNHHP